MAGVHARVRVYCGVVDRSLVGRELDVFLPARLTCDMGWAIIKRFPATTACSFYHCNFEIWPYDLYC